jgi:hypothetical protein
MIRLRRSSRNRLDSINPIQNIRIPLRKGSQSCTICSVMMDDFKDLPRPLPSQFHLQTMMCNTFMDGRTLVSQVPCGHIFHTACILKWEATKLEANEVPWCPLCREVFGQHDSGRFHVHLDSRKMTVSLPSEDNKTISLPFKCTNWESINEFASMAVNVTDADDSDINIYGDQTDMVRHWISKLAESDDQNDGNGNDSEKGNVLQSSRQGMWPVYRHHSIDASSAGTASRRRTSTAAMSGSGARGVSETASLDSWLPANRVQTMDKAGARKFMEPGYGAITAENDVSHRSFSRTPVSPTTARFSSPHGVSITQMVFQVPVRVPVRVPIRDPIRDPIHFFPGVHVCDARMMERTSTGPLLKAIMGYIVSDFPTCRVIHLVETSLSRQSRSGADSTIREHARVMEWQGVVNSQHVIHHAASEEELVAFLGDSMRCVRNLAECLYVLIPVYLDMNTPFSEFLG